MNGVTLSIDDDGPLLAQARARAVSSAREQADQLAEAANAEVGRVRTITETSSTPAPPVPYAVGDFAARAGAASSVPIVAGSQEVRVDVKVVFDLT